MSVLVNFTIFPTDKGLSVSEHVSKIIKMIHTCGASYKLTAMGTIIETETLAEVLVIIENAYKILEPYCDRVYATASFDIRKNKSNRLAQKIQSIEQKIGKVNT